MLAWKGLDPVRPVFPIVFVSQLVERKEIAVSTQETL
jgi:hypothetical protein